VEETRGETEATTTSVHTNLSKLLTQLKTPTHTLSPLERTTSKLARTQILESADTIQDLMAKVMRIATGLFPTKSPFTQAIKKIPQHVLAKNRQ
jgi:hypothetical protein